MLASSAMYKSGELAFVHLVSVYIRGTLRPQILAFHNYSFPVTFGEPFA